MCGDAFLGGNGPWFRQRPFRRSRSGLLGRSLSGCCRLGQQRSAARIGLDLNLSRTCKKKAKWSYRKIIILHKVESITQCKIVKHLMIRFQTQYRLECIPQPTPYLTHVLTFCLVDYFPTVIPVQSHTRLFCLFLFRPLGVKHRLVLQRSRAREICICLLFCDHILLIGTDRWRINWE